MNILHLEASPGWGGQEIRILRESEGMVQRGHRVVMGVDARIILYAPTAEHATQAAAAAFDRLWIGTRRGAFIYDRARQAVVERLDHDQSDRLALGDDDLFPADGVHHRLVDALVRT